MSEVFHQLRWALPIWLVGLLTNWLPDNRITLRLRGMLARPFIRRCGRGLLLGGVPGALLGHALCASSEIQHANCIAPTFFGALAGAILLGVPGALIGGSFPKQGTADTSATH